MLRLGNNILKKAVCFILLIAMVFILTSCPGFNDWEYKLPGNYTVTHVNNQHILFGSFNEPVSLIGNFVYAFCYSDEYIGIMRLPANEGYDEIIDIDALDHSNMEYYLVDVANNEILGPYDPSQYYDLCDKLKTGYIGDWIYCQDLTPDQIPDDRRF